MTHTPQPDDKLTRQEAADLIGISLSRLAQLRRAGEITQRRYPATRNVYYLRRDVDGLKNRRSQVVETT